MGKVTKLYKARTPKRVRSKHRLRASHKAHTLGYRCETYRIALNLKHPGSFTLVAVAKKLTLRPFNIRAVEDGTGTVRDWFAMCELYNVGSPSEILSRDMGY